ncbi:MAG: AMP-binding protein, partial [Pseudonocardia sp.]|nr:AMP-binding protein [Pseudonocardia sp.]
MREYSVPATLRVADDETLVDAVYANAARDESTVAYQRRGADRRWREVTAGEFAREVNAVARGLIAAGVHAGDRVALLSRTRYEWTLIDYAILAVGAATVPIYETSSADQIRWILSDSGAVAVIVETAEHAGLVDEARGGLGELSVWRIEPGSEPGAVERLAGLGESVPEEAVLERRKALRADDLAT